MDTRKSKEDEKNSKGIHLSPDSSSKASIGIDIGFSRCFVAVADGNTTVVLENRRGNRGTPACVAFTDEEELVGHEAERRMEKDPSNAVYGAKRMIGRCFNHPSLQYEKKSFPFKIEKDRKIGGEPVPKIQVQYRNKETLFRPEEIYARMLADMKHDAEVYLKEPSITRAVITVPVSFDESQRRAVKYAAAIAGFGRADLINETTAAAVEYTLRKQVNRRGQGRPRSQACNVLIFHLGGGTCSAVVAIIEDRSIHIRAACGCSDIGGNEFDDSLFEHLMSVMKKKEAVDLDDVESEVGRKAVGRLRKACEKAKKELCNEYETRTNVNTFLVHDYFTSEISREDFESLNKCYIDVIECMIDKAQEVAKVSEFDEIVTAGAGTRMQSIQNMLAKFGKEKIKKIINSDEVAAKGAAAYASFLYGNRSKEEQVTVYDDTSRGHRCCFQNTYPTSDKQQLTPKLRKASVIEKKGNTKHDESVRPADILQEAIKEIERPISIICLSEGEYPRLEATEISQMAIDYANRREEEQNNRKIDERIIAIESHVKQLIGSQWPDNISKKLESLLSDVQRRDNKRPRRQSYERISDQYHLLNEEIQQHEEKELAEERVEHEGDIDSTRNELNILKKEVPAQIERQPDSNIFASNKNPSDECKQAGQNQRQVKHEVKDENQKEMENPAKKEKGYGRFLRIFGWSNSNEARQQNERTSSQRGGSHSKSDIKGQNT